jgi:4-amino-4-deoxy-L-arabinose transferase-like glycosyltransferase
MAPNPEEPAAGASPGVPAARSEKIWLGIILACAAAVRLVGIDHLSLSMDEVSELRIAHAAAGDIVSIGDGFPPLYHLLLHVFVGAGDIAARVVSAICGVAAVAVAWKWAGRIAGPRAARFTAGTIALAPLAVQLSREGRAYGLSLLIAALSLWALWHAIERPSSSNWALWGTVCAVGLYTHYMFVAVVAAEVLVAIFDKRLAAWREMLAGLVTLAVLAAPILLIIGHDLKVQASAARVDVGLIRMLYVPYGLAAGLSLGPSVRDLHTMSAAEALHAAWPWLVALIPTLAAIVVRGYRALDPISRRRLFVLILGGLAISVVAIRLSGVGLRVRYFAWLLIPLAVWAGAGLAALRGALRWAIIGILVVVVSFSLVGHELDPLHQPEDARSVASHLESSGALGDPVLVSGWYMARPIGYYLDAELALALPDVWDPDAGRLGYLPDDLPPLIGIPLLSDDDYPLEHALELIDSVVVPGSAYRLVYSRPFDGDPDGRLLGALRDRDGLELEASFAGIDIYRGARAP